MFEASPYQRIYAAQFAKESQPVEVLANSDGGFVSIPTRALVSEYQDSDLIEGGSIVLGDMKVMLLQADIERLGIPRLGLADRVVIDGRAYAVIHWDAYTRTVGTTTLAVDLIVRGGGAA